MRERDYFSRGWMGALLLCAIVSHGRAETLVFEDGRTLLPVIVTVDASPEERAAGEELARVLEKMSGVTWPVRIERESGERGFHVGRTQTAARHGGRLLRAEDLLAPKPGEIGPDGFRIRTVDGSVFIEAATPEATAFAVAWLLQKHAGARWYAPGDLGEVVPRRTTWTLPELDELRSPAYVSREFYALGSAEEKSWGVRNGLRGRLEFNHALAEVVTARDIAARPEWATLLRGERYEPASSKDHNWQPNLALPAVADHAAQVATAAFAREPWRSSFSLGMNDTVRFDQSEATRALVEPLKYFRGMPDYSPLVFSFMNRAAESLARTRTDRYLGCLAYFWCENTPPFPVHPQVVPYVTTDRSQFYDRAYREADLALMSRWGESGVKAFGLWEYGYGQSFLVPRLPHRALTEAVREGWRRGARGYFMDITPQWGFDAFKVWAIAQLLWEPERTLEELTEDFFSGYYGVAAKPMQVFFERCEAQWMAQDGAPYWLKFYQQEDQALLFPLETCRELRGLLDEAARLAADDVAVKARVALTARAFAVTEAYVMFDDVRRKLSGRVTGTDGGFVVRESTLARLIGELVEARARLAHVWRDAESGDLPAMRGTELSFFTRNDPVPRLLWLAGRRDPAAPRRILQTAGGEAAQERPWCWLTDATVQAKVAAAPELLVNGSFAETARDGQEPGFLFPRSGALPDGWQVNSVPTEHGKIALERDDADSARRLLRLEGSWDAQVYQWMPAEPGSVYVARAQLRGKSGPGNDSGFFMTFLSAEGKVVGTHRMQSLPKGTTDVWRQAVLLDLAPAEAAWIGLGIGASRQVGDDWFEATALELRATKAEVVP